MPIAALLTLSGILLSPIWYLIFQGYLTVPYALGLLLTLAGGTAFVRVLAGELRRHPRARHAPRARIALLALTLIALYLLLELGASAFIVFTGLRAPLSAFRQKLTMTAPPGMVPHPFTLYINNPANADVNSLGFLGPEWTPVKPDGVVRVACLGGSTTVDGYPIVLQEVLDRRTVPGHYEVMNFGVSGWTSAHTLINYLLNVRTFHPDWIVLHHAANDFKAIGFSTIKPDYSHAFKSTTVLEPEWDSALVRCYNSYALGKWMYYQRRNLPVGATLTDLAQIPPDDMTKALEEIEPVVALFGRNIESLLTQARADGINVLIVTQPYSRKILWWSEAFPPFMEQANNALRAMAARNNTPLLDLEQILAGQEEYHIDPLHLTKDGVYFKAGRIADFFEPRAEDTPSSH